MPKHSIIGATEADDFTRRRAECHLLGFTAPQSRALAATRDADGAPLPIERVRRALEAGCTHEQALRIWL